MYPLPAYIMLNHQSVASSRQNTNMHTYEKGTENEIL